MKKPFKIPTVLALAVILAVFVTMIYSIKYLQSHSTQTPEGVTPQDVRVTNISENTFTVSWLTNAKVNGFLVWGKENVLENVTGNNPPDFEMVHTTTITNLSPSATYSFNIISGGLEFDNSGKPWEIKTASQLSPPKHSQIISGSVTTDTGSPTPQALVLVSGTNLSPLSTVTSQDGSWFIPLSISRTEDLLSYFEFDSEDELTIFVHAGVEGIASATIYANTNPIPPIIIGRAQDFRDKWTSLPLEMTRAKIDLSKNNSQPSGFATEEKTQTDEPEESKPVSSPQVSPEPVFQKLQNTDSSFSLITPSKSEQIGGDNPPNNLTPVLVAPIMGISLFLIGAYVGRKLKD